MADLNALIAQGAQFRQAPDPFVQYGQMQQLEQNQQTNALNQMKMQEMQRGVEEQNQLRRLDPAAADYLQQVSRINPKTGFEFGKLRQEAKTAELTEQKTRGEVQAQQAKAIGSALTIAMSNPTDAGLNQAFSMLDGQKIDTKGLRSQFANITDPTERLKAIQSYATAHPEGIAAMKFVAPDPMQVTKADGSIIFLDKNPHSPNYGKQILPPQAAGMTQTQAATVETGRGQLKVSQDRLDFDRAEAKFKKDNPGFKLQAIEKTDGTTEYYAVNEITKVATRITLDGTPLTGVNLSAQTAAIRQKFDQDKLDFERKNPGFTIEQATQADGTIKFKKVNKQTGEATDVMDVSGTPLTGAAKITLSPLATLQKELVDMPKGSPQAKEHQAKILKEITDTSQAQLKLAQDRFAWDKANPNHHIEALNNPDGSQKFVAVNTRTRQAYPITETEISNKTPPNIGAPLVGAAAGVTPAPVAAQTSGGPAAAPAQPSSAPATQGQPVPLTSARPYKEPTTPEQNAGYNIGRILRAATSIQDVIAKDPTALAPRVGEALASSFGLGGVANAARTGNRQIVYGAQRDVVDALLYLATGAAYNTGQILAQRDTYMPQFTDKPETVIEKQRRLVELLGDAKTRAGKAWTPKMDAAMNALNIQSAAPGGVDANNPLLRGK